MICTIFFSCFLEHVNIYPLILALEIFVFGNKTMKLKSCFHVHRFNVKLNEVIRSQYTDQVSQ